MPRQNAQVIEDQLIEARVQEIREKRDHGYNVTFNPGDNEVDALVTGSSELRSTEGDKVMVISTEDGEVRAIPSVMLAKTLKKRRNGKRAFEMVDPETGSVTGPVPMYQGGDVPCWFNPKSDRYEALQAIPGLRGFNCPSEKLASEFDAEMHAKNRHTRRYQVAKDAMDRAEREEDRRIRREEIEAMRAMAAAATGKAG